MCEYVLVFKEIVNSRRIRVEWVYFSNFKRSRVQAFKNLLILVGKFYRTQITHQRRWIVFSWLEQKRSVIFAKVNSGIKRDRCRTTIWAFVKKFDCLIYVKVPKSKKQENLSIPHLLNLFIQFGIFKIYKLHSEGF